MPLLYRHILGQLFRAFLGVLAVLTLLPFLIVWQLNGMMRLIWMPVLTLVGIGLFALGTRLRGGRA